MNPPVLAVIFDMDGVLTDSEPLINAAAVAMFRERGVEVQPDDFVPFIGTGEDRYLGGVAERYGVSLDLNEAKRRTYEIYLALVPERLKAFPGAVELVRACRAAGLRVAVASSADRIKIDANLVRIGLPPSDWDAVVGAEDVVQRKPAPDLFLAAAARLGVSPSQCVVVEDAVHGIEAARAAGMPCLAVAQTLPAAELSAADQVIHSMAEATVGDLRAMRRRPPPLGAARAAGLAPVALEAGPTDAGLTAPENRRPWGAWATLGWSAVLVLVFVGAQVVALIGVAVAKAATTGGSLLTTLQTAGTSGFAMALAYLMAAPPTLWLSAYLARLRGIGGSARAYLALRGVGKRRVAFWCVALVVYLFVSDWVLVLLGQSAGAEQMIGFFKNSWFPPLLWFSVVVLAPLTEEVVVRGFMFRGLVHSRVGAWGAVLIPNLAWTALHAYYDLPGMLVVFGAGLMFGWARLRTDSLYPPIAMHLVMNLGATLQVEWLIRSGQLN